jgi:hypothetical protein
MRHGGRRMWHYEFLSRICLRRGAGPPRGPHGVCDRLRGMVEKFRSMEFGLCVHDALGGGWGRHDNGGSDRKSIRDNRAGFSCFGNSIRPARNRQECTAAAPRVRATICTRNGAAQKNPYITMAYNETSITVACYLCNTHPKTVCRVLSGAVPLLRVQGASVIVMLRRRGASRGRPVLGGSLKSLAFMRECPKARSG